MSRENQQHVPVCIDSVWGVCIDRYVYYHCYIYCAMRAISQHPRSTGSSLLKVPVLSVSQRLDNCLSDSKCLCAWALQPSLDMGEAGPAFLMQSTRVIPCSFFSRSWISAGLKRMRSSDGFVPAHKAEVL